MSTASRQNYWHCLVGLLNGGRWYVFFRCHGIYLCMLMECELEIFHEVAKEV